MRSVGLLLLLLTSSNCARFTFSAACLIPRAIASSTICTWSPFLECGAGNGVLSGSANARRQSTPAHQNTKRTPTSFGSFAIQRCERTLKNLPCRIRISRHNERAHLLHIVRQATGEAPG